MTTDQIETYATTASYDFHNLCCRPLTRASALEALCETLLRMHGVLSTEAQELRQREAQVIVPFLTLRDGEPDQIPA